MINVGLTGGIGSGKSKVAEIFAGLGIAIYEADSRAKKLMLEDVELRKSITSIFGDEVYVKGELDRKHLASLVFNDKSKLNRLNSIVHPAVRKDYKDWAKSQKSPYNIREAAILFESGSYKECDHVILITAPEQLRIKRVMKRDGSSKEEVKLRMDKQWPDEKKAKRSDFIINNDESNSLEEQVLKIHEALMKIKK